jgi:hypothetical protein
MDSVAEENVDKLEQEHQQKTDELVHVKSTTIQQMWQQELTALEAEYSNYKEARERIMSGESKKIAKAVKKTTTSSSNVVNVKKTKLSVVV